MDALFSRIGSKDIETLRKKLVLAEKLQVLEKLKEDYEKKIKKY